MLFTWDTNNLCIVFKSWRITSTMSLIWSLLGVMLLTAGYELVREMSRRYEAKVQREIDDMPSKYFVPFVVTEISCLLCLLAVSTWCLRLEISWLKWLLNHKRRSRRKLIARIRTQRCRRVCKVENHQGCSIRHSGVLFLLHHVSVPCFLFLCSL